MDIYVYLVDDNDISVKDCLGYHRKILHKSNTKLAMEIANWLF